MALPSEKHQALFAALVGSYTSQAMVCLGKLASPATGKQERDLEQASVLIDMLQMLEARTEGNLTEEEASALRQSLSMLRLNYVDEKGKPEQSAEEVAGGAKEPGGEPPAGDAPADEAAPAGAGSAQDETRAETKETDSGSTTGASEG